MRDKGWVNKADTIEIVDKGGALRAVGVSGSITGKGADIAIIDDPIKNRDEAYSPTYRERVWGWFQSTLRTRLEGNHAGICVIMTRWHQDDLVGRLLRIADDDPDADQWVVVNLPAIKEGPPDEDDPRNDGEALWPERYDEKYLKQTRAASGEAVWESLYQGHPTSQAGEIVRREWINKYNEYPVFNEIVQAWDLNFGKTAKSAKSSYVSGQCWGRAGANYYLLEALRGKWTHTQNKREVTLMQQRWANFGCGCKAVYIEDAASGAPLIDDLKGTVPGLIPVRPIGSKVARFESVAPLFEAGQIYIPDKNVKWINAWVEEIVSFPGAPNDDQADACAMALTKLTKESADYSKFCGGRIGGHRVPDRLG
jgi:predicted phage terminase large subunit-like protein